MAIKSVIRLKKEDFKTTKEYLEYINSPARLAEDSMRDPKIRKIWEDYVKQIYALRQLKEIEL